MWSKVTEEEGMQRAAELASLDDFFKPALEKKARLMHHTRDTVESIHEIVRAIMENHPVPLIIQEELVNEGKDIKQTEAGQEVEKRILELMAEFERKIKEGQAAAEEARKQRDEEAMQEILEERAKNDEKLAKVREENAKHAERYKELQARLIAHEARAAADKAALEAQLAARLQAQHISVPQQANHQPQARRRPATYYTITSGKQHTIWNEAHQFYATIDGDEKYG
jgi:type I site-specific restriction-modification system R (restriction) subunit